MAEKVLPPLPPSDKQSLIDNKWDSLNQTRSASFWGDNQVEHIELKPMKKCTHKFINFQQGVRCSKCNTGFIGISATQAQQLLKGGNA